MTVVYILPDEDTECGGILTASTGVIQTQDRNNDGKYEAYTDCPWAIIAQNNSLIELQFHNFSLEYEPLCSFDFLEVCFYIFFILCDLVSTGQSCTGLAISYDILSRNRIGSANSNIENDSQAYCTHDCRFSHANMLLSARI